MNMYGRFHLQKQMEVSGFTPGQKAPVCNGYIAGDPQDKWVAWQKTFSPVGN